MPLQDCDGRPTDERCQCCGNAVKTIGQVGGMVSCRRELMCGSTVMVLLETVLPHMATIGKIRCMETRQESRVSEIFSGG